MDKHKILVIDDDKNICDLLALYLEDEGFTLYFAHDGSMGLDMIKKNPIDLVLLDVMLPSINGWEVLKMIRKTSQVAVIMITAKDMVEDKLQGFDLGANDYIVKPFDPREVIARVKARLKDYPEENKNSKKILKYKDLVIDMNRYEVLLSGQALALKPKEIQLIYFLMNNQNIVFSRDKLLERVWDYDFIGDTRTVDVHIKNLREKIIAAGAPIKIKTVWGVGYKLEVI